MDLERAERVYTSPPCNTGSIGSTRRDRFDVLGQPGGRKSAPRREGHEPLPEMLPARVPRGRRRTAVLVRQFAAVRSVSFSGRVDGAAGEGSTGGSASFFRRWRGFRRERRVCGWRAASAYLPGCRRPVVDHAGGFRGRFVLRSFRSRAGGRGAVLPRCEFARGVLRATLSCAMNMGAGQRAGTRGGRIRYPRVPPFLPPSLPGGCRAGRGSRWNPSVAVDPRGRAVAIAPHVLLLCRGRAGDVPPPFPAVRFVVRHTVARLGAPPVLSGTRGTVFPESAIAVDPSTDLSRRHGSLTLAAVRCPDRVRR